MRRVAWFSCGAASAVAAKLSGAHEVVYCDTMQSEHADNFRFFTEVQEWLGRPIKAIRSDKYTSIDDVFFRTRYMSGIAGARCTVEMKKLPRVAFQRPYDIHIFGYTADEQKRADAFEDNNPDLQVEWTLIEKGITKAHCLKILADAGIKLPAMYSLGFDHNNCIGCVKATSPGYWTKVRQHFPQIFKRRAEQSRALGVRLARVNNVRVFLDELKDDFTTPDDAIECGPICQTELDL